MRDLQNNWRNYIAQLPGIVRIEAPPGTVNSIEIGALPLIVQLLDNTFVYTKLADLEEKLV